MKLLLLPLQFVLATTVLASQGDQIVQALAECSPTYFAQVRDSADISSAAYTFTPLGRLVVPNHRDEVGPGYWVLGKRELLIGGLRVVGMYDLHTKAHTYESLNWGLLVKGLPQDLVLKINEVLPREKALDSDLMFGFARLEKTSISLEKTSLKKWPLWDILKPLPTQSIPEFGEIEMAMEVTIANEKLAGISRVGCSLQGVFPPFVVKRRRPDID